MPYTIDQDTCTGCAACEPECPNDAIREKSGLFTINADKCTECADQFDEPQCVAVCPIDDCVTLI